MEKKQLLIIEPQNELKFRGPFSSSVTSHMRLINPTDKPLLFKIKTTAPKKYCVRPNSGRVEPKGVAEVAICLQPFTFDPNEKNKHKFMVQSCIAPEGEFNFDQLWKELEPDQLMDSKLRCVFELPPENTTNTTASFSQTSAALIKNEASSSGSEANQAGRDDKPIDANSEYVKAAHEVRQLREEESQLRLENLQLKEQVLRLGASIEAKERTSFTSSAPPIQNSYSPPQVNQQFHMAYVGIAIIMAILGIILGKFIL